MDLDLDLLGSHLQRRIDQEQLSLREAAKQVGCSAATLGRLLVGKKVESVPDTRTLFQVVSWLGKSITDFEIGARPSKSSIADVELHLRALPGLSEKDRESLVAIVRAAHDTYRLRATQE